ncbi:Dynactin subunit 2 [Gryllus bimaculatus]|nr:Dynactin subunit 2 [Gryllus bimaculatus]
MANPKYADLPGIAYDQPDVYETEDLPEADQNADFYEEETDSIERLHISANEAFGRFKGKSLNAASVDFSDRITKSRRSGYEVLNWEIVGEGEKETPLQKYQRLQIEIKELAEEVNQLKETGVPVGGDQPPPAQLAQLVEAAQRQLAEVHLEEALGSELLADLKDPEGARVMRLLTELESLRQGSTDIKAKGDAPSGQPAAGVVSYELQFRPEQSELSRSSRLAQLEQRLHFAESALGATPERMATLCVDPRDRARPCSLLEAVQLLSAKVSLLDTAHLDHVEGRLIALAQKMDSIADKNSSTVEDAERDQKVIELYDLMKKNSEEVAQILPETLDRMLTLQALHQQAADFGKSLSQLEAVQQQISGSLHNSEQLLQEQKDSFLKQLELLKSNLARLDSRITALGKK